ncbi:MAG: CvpA family protein [Verrucomicrobia bacterium]|nr:CvpA family protein [Verrucomicrobiota bacterium]
MLVWTIVILIFAILALGSYYKGAIRSGVSLIGLFLAVWLSLPLGVHLRPLVPKLGLTHPAWPYVLPPLTVFFLFVLIFGAAGFLIHYKIHTHYKLAADDYTRIKWERLNRKLGLSVGVLGGLVYSLLVGLIIYMLGYPAVQFTTDSSPAIQRALSSARKQLAETGMDRAVAALDPLPPRFYRTVDVLGLIYHNPSVHERLANYPPFLDFAERSEFQDIANDAQIMNALQTQAPILSILNNPKILGLIQNQEIMGKLAQVDLDDLYDYLKTGKSKKYDEEQILGRWKLDVPATYIAIRRKQPDMTVRDMRTVKTMLTVFLPKLQFMATPSRNAYMKLELTDQAQALINAAKKRVEAARQAAQQAANPYGYDPLAAQRYGMPAQEETPKEEPTQSFIPKMPGMPAFDFQGEGNWSKRSGKYIVRLRSGKKAVVASAEVDQDSLRLTIGNVVLVFYPAMYRL